MDPILLRHLWTVIETAQGSFLLSMDDHRLVQWVLEQLSNQFLLDSRDTPAVSRYLRARLSLIRDLAHNQ